MDLKEILLALTFRSDIPKTSEGVLRLLSGRLLDALRSYIGTFNAQHLNVNV